MLKTEIQKKDSCLKIFLTKNQTEIQKQNILETYKYKSKFGQTCLLAESKELYAGLSYSSTSQTIDPFSKVDYYALGAKVQSVVTSTNFEEVLVDSLEDITPINLEHFVLGFLQACYKFDAYLKEKTTKQIGIVLSKNLINKLDIDTIEYIKAVTQGIKLTRYLIDETPQKLNPTTYPQIIQKEFEEYKNVTIKTFDYDTLDQMGMEGVNAVGRGSINKPVMTHTIIKPKGESKKKIVLVGKGITYDSGGLDIKTGGNMRHMKSDMGGSATMCGVSKTIASLGLENTEVHWISAFCENMVDANSYKADDILTSYSGQTIEIYNTDAEGRLTLADALAYATTLDPDYIVDAATLTGACLVAVSEYYTALMSNSEYLKNTLIKQFEDEQEPTVYTPMPEVLRQYVKGNNSDLVNTHTIGRQAGHITAGLFLSHFVDQNLFRNPNLNIDESKCYEWVHLDIAGSAMNNKKNSLGVNGATGQSVRSISKWILLEDQKK